MSIVNSYLDQSVSTATLNTKHLLEAFIPVLNELGEANSGNITFRNVLRSADGHLRRLKALSVEDADEQNASEFLNEILFEKMNDFSPDGYYFGAHMGDGADFGFWKMEEEAEDGTEDFGVPFTPEYPGRDASNPFEW